MQQACRPPSVCAATNKRNAETPAAVPGQLSRALAQQTDLKPSSKPDLKMAAASRHSGNSLPAWRNQTNGSDSTCAKRPANWWQSQPPAAACFSRLVEPCASSAAFSAARLNGLRRGGGGLSSCQPAAAGRGVV